MRNLARRGASSGIIQTYAQPFARVGLDHFDAWIRVHYVYRAEQQEVIRTPQFMIYTLEERGFFDGDCDDVSTLIASMLKVVDRPVRFVAIRANDGPEFTHVYVEAWAGTQWQILDPTVDPGTTYQVTERMVLDV